MQLIYLLILILPALISSEPISLTDKTWKDMLCGQWMVELLVEICVPLTPIATSIYPILVMHHGVHHVNTLNLHGMILLKQWFRKK